MKGAKNIYFYLSDMKASNHPVTWAELEAIFDDPQLLKKTTFIYDTFERDLPYRRNWSEVGKNCEPHDKRLYRSPSGASSHEELTLNALRADRIPGFGGIGCAGNCGRFACRSACHAGIPHLRHATQKSARCARVPKGIAGRCLSHSPVRRIRLGTPTSKPLCAARRSPRAGSSGNSTRRYSSRRSTSSAITNSTTSASWTRRRVRRE